MLINFYQKLAFFTSIGLITISCLLIAKPALAQNEGRSYQVEVLIFKRNFASLGNNENWQQDIRLAYPQNTSAISDIVPKSQHQLGGHNYTLRRSEQYTVLFHKAWRQTMWEKAKSPWLIIRGGRDFGEHKELEGAIRIHIGRYLHVTTDLWLSDYSSPSNLAAVNRTPIPLLGRSTSTFANFNQSRSIPNQLYIFREKRRMRSKETHYIDHPLMGIMVRMLPLK